MWLITSTLMALTLPVSTPVSRVAPATLPVIAQLDPFAIVVKAGQPLTFSMRFLNPLKSSFTALFGAPLRGDFEIVDERGRTVAMTLSPNPDQRYAFTLESWQQVVPSGTIKSFTWSWNQKTLAGDLVQPGRYCIQGGVSALIQIQSLKEAQISFVRPPVQGSLDVLPKYLRNVPLVPTPIKCFRILPQIVSIAQ